MKYPIYVLSAALTVCCLQWSAAARSAELAKPHEQVEKIHLRAGKLPSVELTADFLYRFLASEIAAQRGQYDAASQPDRKNIELGKSETVRVEPGGSLIINKK